MKETRIKTTLLLSFAALVLLSGCDHDLSIRSAVHEDGSLDRTIVLHDVDSTRTLHNFIGATKATGWNLTLATGTQSDEGKEKKSSPVFTRHFSSVAEANAIMDTPSDTVFHIHSTFEKRNRWFYTYITYSDTYRALDRFIGLSSSDYFTPEDYAFIDRLPAEGKPVSKADSLYLARLQEKIFDIYGNRKIFEEVFADMLSTLRQYNVEPRWTDSLMHRKEEIYRQFVDGEGIEDNAFLYVADYVHIPLPDDARKQCQQQSETMERRLKFISDAYTTRFHHSIQMPWTVVASNADSIAYNELFWNPPAIKFVLKDYTMTATARRLNLWTLAISALVVLFTVGLFLRRKTSTRIHT